MRGIPAKRRGGGAPPAHPGGLPTGLDEDGGRRRGRPHAGAPPSHPVSLTTVVYEDGERRRVRPDVANRPVRTPPSDGPYTRSPAVTARSVTFGFGGNEVGPRPWTKRLASRSQR